MPFQQPGEYADYYQKYINLVGEDSIEAGFRVQRERITDFLLSVSEEKANLAYAPGKWTIKELMQHVIDTERVFTFRAMAFARKDPNSFPGFEEDDYARVSDANRRSWADLVAEFWAVRGSTEALFRSFTDEMLLQTGRANQNPMSVRAAGYVCMGHVYHHLQVVQDRYLNK
jgi:hypothetical protein